MDIILKILSLIPYLCIFAIYYNIFEIIGLFPYLLVFITLQTIYNMNAAREVLGLLSYIFLCILCLYLFTMSIIIYITI